MNYDNNFCVKNQSMSNNEKKSRSSNQCEHKHYGNDCLYRINSRCDLCKLSYCSFHIIKTKWKLSLCNKCENHRRRIYYGCKLTLRERYARTNNILFLYNGSYSNPNYKKHNESFYNWTNTFQFSICKQVPKIAKKRIRKKIYRIVNMYLTHYINNIVVEYYIE